MDFGPRTGDRLAYIFTLGQPTEELMKLLWTMVIEGGMKWVVVPVEDYGREEFEHLPENTFIGV